MSSTSSTQRLANLIRDQFRVILIGPPGTAKTARVLAATRLLGWRFFYGIGNRTCDLMDRLDAAGAVVPDVASGVSRTLPLDALREIMECREPAVLFLDEIGRAPLDVQGGLNSLMDALKRAGSPVVVVAASNRPQDKAGVASLSEQLRSRFDVAFAIATPGDEPTPTGATYLADWAGEVTGWCDYAVEAGFDPAIVGWHRRTSGRTLYAWKPNANAALRMPDFRTWETVARLMKAGLADLDTVGAAIGRGPAAEFLAFASLASQLPTPTEVFTDPANAMVPSDPAACYLLSASLALSVTPKQVPALLVYIDRLPRVFTALAGRDVAKRLGGGGDDKRRSQLVNVPEWNRWFLANQTLFSV